MEKKIKTYKIIYCIAFGLGIFYLVTFMIPASVVCLIVGFVYFYLCKKLRKQNESQVQPSGPIKVESNTVPNQPQHIVKKYKVAGVTHYIDNIMLLSSENLDYNLTKKELIDEGIENERIYQYNFYPINVELVPEPNNPHDPKAVKVLVDNIHVGYIKSGSCSHILNLISENRIEKIDCEIAGGKYKYLNYDEDTDKYELESEDIPLFVHLRISEK